MDVSCIILAGGKSKRLGRNKVTEIIGNKSLLEIAISRLSSLNCEIIVVTAKDSTLPQLTDYPQVKLVQDIFPGKGSLGGLYTGLNYSQTFYNLVVACDMPFINLDLLHHMIDMADGYDAVIPKVGSKGILEPLHAVYSKNCLPYLKSLIDENKLSILDLFPLIKVKYIEDQDLDQFDPERLSFFNINTENDLRVGKELARKEDFTNDQR